MRWEAPLVVAVAAAVATAGCIQVTPGPDLGASDAETEADDAPPTGYRLVNATVWTADEDRPRAEAVAVRNDTIVAVGAEADVRAADVGPRPATVDLGGRMVLPGFHDTHTHLTQVARNADPSEGNPFKPWRPNRDPIEQAVSNQVVAADHVGTYASRNADRAEDGKEPFLPSDGSGGSADVDGADDHNHSSPLTDLGPWPEDRGNDRETWLDMLRLGVDTAARYGVTSHAEAGAPLDVFEVYDELQRTGDLDARFNVYVFPPSLDEVLERNMTTGWGDERAQLLGLKIYSDGWMGPRTAALREPYEDRPHNGIIFYTQEEVDRYVQKAYRNGLKVTAHSIGDRATDRMLTAYERALARGCPEDADHEVCEDPRFSLEHAQLTQPDLVQRMQAVDLYPSVQLSFATSDAPWAEDALGEERLRHAYAWNTLVEANLTVGGSSDFPIEVIPPLWGIQRMVTRQDVDGYPAGGFLPSEKVQLETALKMVTIDAARLEHREDELGSLTEGKLADVVVLDHNLFEVPQDEIWRTNVEATMVGGEVIHAEGAVQEQGLRVHDAAS
jgi:predicted amidohydrolase YtcJ